jgi:acyl-CoA synthetase (AMP-forming)/AMP-acid ligase II
MLMLDRWLDIFSRRGENTAILEDDSALSYAGLAASSLKTAQHLAECGVRQQSVVVLNADFSIASITAFFALVHLRAIIIPMVTLTESGFDTARRQCGAEFLCRTSPGLTIERLATDSQPALYETLRKRETSGLVLLSSGSTGTSKAILHDLGVLMAAQKVKNVRDRLVIILLLLFDHIGGINTLVNSLFSGGVAIVATERSPEAVCRLIERRRVKVLPASPTFLNLILIAGLDKQFDLSSLRLITYGAEPMPEELLRRVREAFPRARLLQTFGTSETGIAATASESSGSTFFKIEGGNVSYRIVNGELYLKSRTQFLGYLNQSEDVLTEDGWFPTGDLVEETEAGFLRIRGRIGEVINVAGEKVLPTELETLILQSPMIADCLVYGELNALAGQIVCADIVPRSPAMARSEVRQHIHEFLADRVERFKIPSRINIVREVARSERFKKSRIRQ